MKKVINGIEITDETFERVTAEQFDSILESIRNGESDTYSGYVEVQSFDDFDFIASDFTDDITDGIRYAMLSTD